MGVLLKLMIISQSKELEDVQLRQNERSVLNALNNDGKIPKSKAGLEALDLRRDKQVIRFIMPGKVKSRDMKINVLLQAELGCVPIGDGNNSLRQDNYRIFKVGERISKCKYFFLFSFFGCNSCSNKSNPKIKKLFRCYNQIILFEN